MGGQKLDSYVVRVIEKIKCSKVTSIVDEPYDGYVYDVTVPRHHVLLVERNGKPVFSGNSYHIQKEIEQMPAGMKPQILFMGHTHQSVLMPDYRSVAAFYCGTFEDQTLYLKRKHIAPHIGGWIVEAGITANGSLKTLSTTWVRYFHSRRGPLRMPDLEKLGDEVRMERVLGLPVE